MTPQLNMKHRSGVSFLSKQHSNTAACQGQRQESRASLRTREPCIRNLPGSGSADVPLQRIVQTLAVNNTAIESIEFS